MTVDVSKEAFMGFTLAQRVKLNNALRKAQNKVTPKVKTPTASSTAPAAGTTTTPTVVTIVPLVPQVI